MRKQISSSSSYSWSIAILATAVAASMKSKTMSRTLTRDHVTALTNYVAKAYTPETSWEALAGPMLDEWSARNIPLRLTVITTHGVVLHDSAARRHNHAPKSVSSRGRSTKLATLLPDVEERPLLLRSRCRTPTSFCVPPIPSRWKIRRCAPSRPCLAGPPYRWKLSWDSPLFVISRKCIAGDDDRFVRSACFGRGCREEVHVKHQAYPDSSAGVLQPHGQDNRNPAIHAATAKFS